MQMVYFQGSANGKVTLPSGEQVDEMRLSSTQAENYRSVANELAKPIAVRLSKLSFINEKITTVETTAEPKLKKQGADLSVLNSLSEDVERLGLINAFNAYIAEARKAKQRNVLDVKSYSFLDYLVQTGRLDEYSSLVRPVEPLLSDYIKTNLTVAEPVKPELPESLNADSAEDPYIKDILSKRNIKDVTEYLMTEAKAAVFGNVIMHKDQQFKCAYDNLCEAREEPITDEGAYLLYRDESVPFQEVQKVASQLQSKYRDYESHLNRLKSAVKTTAEKQFEDAQADYQTKLSKYNSDMVVYQQQRRELSNKWDILHQQWEVENAQYETAVNKLYSDYLKWETAKESEMNKLKIVIPVPFMGLVKEIKEFIKD